MTFDVEKDPQLLQRPLLCSMWNNMVAKGNLYLTFRWFDQPMKQTV